MASSFTENRFVALCELTSDYWNEHSMNMFPFVTDTGAKSQRSSSQTMGTVTTTVVVFCYCVNNSFLQKETVFALLTSLRAYFSFLPSVNTFSGFFFSA